jgi:nucleoside-diphosphate-sugar epimerase
MKILVTGANGFIGQALCAELAQKGSDAHSVIRAVRTARSPGDVVLQLDDLHKAGNDLAQALSGTEVVVHLAKCDAVGTENLARQCALHGVRRLVFVSTAKVHGEGYDHAVGSPYTEQDRPQPLDAYAQSKWEAEQRLWEVAGQTNLEVVVLRPPMVYGPGVGGNFLKLMQSVSASTFFLPLPLGAIQNQRSLIYVGNLVDVIGVCLGHPHAAGQTFLVSDGQAM